MALPIYLLLFGLLFRFGFAVVVTSENQVEEIHPTCFPFNGARLNGLEKPPMNRSDWWCPESLQYGFMGYPLEMDNCSDPSNLFPKINADFQRMKYEFGATMVRIYAPQCREVSIWENLLRAGIANNMAVLPQVWWGFEANQSLWKLTANSIVDLLSDPELGPVAPYVFHSIAFGSEPIGDDVDGGPTQFTADLQTFKERIIPFQIPVTISEDWDRPGIMSNQNWTGLGPVGMEIAPIIDLVHVHIMPYYHANIFPTAANIWPYFETYIPFLQKYLPGKPILISQTLWSSILGGSHDRGYGNPGENIGNFTLYWDIIQSKCQYFKSHNIGWFVHTYDDSQEPGLDLMQEDETQPDATLAPPNDFNPWSSIPPTAATPNIISSIPHDESSHPGTQTDETVEPSKTSPDSLVLKEFDPLAPSLNEAQEAWAASEGHVPIESSLEVTENKESLEQPPQSPDSVKSTPAPPIAPQSTPSAFISSIPSSLASFAKNLTISPKRSVTPPLPPPPRTSSLRHNHHSSLPVNVLPPAESEVNLPRSVSQEMIQSVTTSNERNVQQTKLDGSFDFQKFLDQMKSRSADPIAKYLRSFLSNFAKKTYSVKDQIKIINDFLDFIADKMRNLEGSPWQHATEQEFDHALDAMEKLVMNRLYELTFQPLLPPSSRTTDDIERDHVLWQRILLFGWLKPEHLDIPFKDPNQFEENGFLEFAQQELLKINHYKAPRDKLICILNCCKVIFGLIRHLKLSEGADSFLPILIYVVLKANPDYLLSNVEYINRFRRQDKLQSEAGYYLSSLMGAVSFIETMDHTALSNITQEEFEGNVEMAIEDLSIDERVPTPPVPSTQAKLPSNTSGKPSISLVGEEAARPLSLPMPDHSSGTIESPQLSLAEDTRKFFQKTSDTISKPLTAIGRIFSEMLDDQRAPRNGNEAAASAARLGQTPSIAIPSDPSSPVISDQSVAKHTPGDTGYQAQIHTPYKPRVRPAHLNSSTRLSSSSTDYTHPPRGLIPPSQQALLQSRGSTPSPLPSRTASPSGGLLYAGASTPHSSRMPTPTLDFSALQDEIERAHTAAQNAARETLKQIFPSVETEVADMVLEANNGDLGGSIEALLEISGQQQNAS